MVAEMSGIDFIHLGERVHVREEHGGLYDALKRGARGLENAREVLQAQVGLSRDVPGVEFAGLGVQWDLPLAKYPAVGDDRLGIRPDRRRGVVGVHGLENTHLFDSCR